MYSFSEKSLQILDTCDPRLREIMHALILVMDVTIIEGHRSKDRQNRMHKDGFSKLPYPHSKHNTFPSLAVDVAPYPIDWQDRERFVFMAGHILGIASMMGYKIRWGGNFNMNDDLHDENFYDLPHFEIL